MAQNRSSAVMQQRIEPDDSLDDFPTQPWGTRALLMMLSNYAGYGIEFGSTVREPAANRGFMVRPLAERFQRVLASDVHDYGLGYDVRDYLWPDDVEQPDWTISNPPFRLAKDFIAKARTTSRFGCAMLVRTSFLEGKDRFLTLYKENRPNFVFQFVERLPMVKGRCDPDASTATSYCWLVWLTRVLPQDTIFDWIPPCRAQLERKATDYVIPAT